MNSDGIVYDLNEIRKLLPEPIIRLILSKVVVSEPPDESGYKNLPVVHNRKDWLWRALVKFIVPFQMKTTRRGFRTLSAAGFSYMMFQLFVIYFFVAMGLGKYLVYLAWTYVIVRALLPYITAVIKLTVNKHYYASVQGRA